MATKSILKSITVSGKKNSNNLATALERSANIKPHKVEISKKVKELSSDAILAIWGVR